MIEYFTQKIKIVFPLNVYSTGCYFIRKFYLSASIFEYHPFFICYLCFYISAKVEHHYMSVSGYIKLLPEYYHNFKQQFIEKEIDILKNINFELNHSSIFCAIDGLLLHYEFYMNNKATDEEKSISRYFSSDNQNKGFSYIFYFSFFIR